MGTAKVEFPPRQAHEAAAGGAVGVVTGSNTYPLLLIISLGADQYWCGEL